MLPTVDADISGPKIARSRGLTLVEVLVVIGIIGLLTAILVPAIASVREHGVRVACAVNLRHVGTAVTQYVSEFYYRLPTHHTDPSIAFDTFCMRGDDEQLVNLGLLIGYTGQPETFYCPSQTADRSPCIAFDSAQNRWRWGRRSGGGGGGGGSGGGGGNGPGGPSGDPGGNGGQELNSSFTARARAHLGTAAPAWTLLNHTNKVIYTDFIGVDDWPGRGRLSRKIRAPHVSSGYNRLFGDGSAQWTSADALNRLRPVDAAEPTPDELGEYFKLLDVLP